MLRVHTGAVHTELAQRGADLLDHVPGPADEILTDLLGEEQRGCELPHPRGVEPPVVQLDFLRLAAHQEMQRQPLEVAVLERQQLLEAHRAAGAAVAVEEDDPLRATASTGVMPQPAANAT